MLKVSLAFDSLLSTGSERQEAPSAGSRRIDAQMVVALAGFRLSRGATELRPIDVRDLRPGMILNGDLRLTTGTLLAAKNNLKSRMP